MTTFGAMRNVALGPSRRRHPRDIGLTGSERILARPKLNHADVDDADPDNVGACVEWARADASVNEVALPERHDGADGARRERGCVRVLELRADVHAHAVRQDAAKDRPP
jgi:hypothetical protein